MQRQSNMKIFEIVVQMYYRIPLPRLKLVSYQKTPNKTDILNSLQLTPITNETQISANQRGKKNTHCEPRNNQIKQLIASFTN